jgi:hypothetical protein
MEVSGQLHAPAALPPGERAPGTVLDRGLGGPQSRSGRRGEEKKTSPYRQSNPGRLVRSPSLYRLSYPYTFFLKCRSKILFLSLDGIPSVKLQLLSVTA